MWQKNPNKKAVLLDESSLRHKAIELLARREYSYAELESKLLPFSEEEAPVYTVLDWLIEMGLQSDARYAKMYVRSKALGGYGPVRIRLELKQKGINPFLMEDAFFEAESEISWPDEVDRLIEKKAKSLDLADYKDKNKVMGYLQRRGYSLDQIYAGFERCKSQTV